MKANVKNTIIILITLLLFGSISSTRIVATSTAQPEITQEVIAEVEIPVQNKQIIFYVQHQDDEVLFVGSAIVDAINSFGVDNVHVVLVTDGSGSGVFKFDRYINLAKEEKSQLRTNEFNSSLESLGVDMKNVIYLNQPEDNVVLDSLRETILNFEESYNEVTHISHSYKYDMHPQHLATGNLVYELYQNKQIKEVKFFTLKKYMDGLDESLVTEIKATNEEDRLKVINACRQYEMDNGDMVREGIGYKSVASMFDILTSDPEVISYLHSPE